MSIEWTYKKAYWKAYSFINNHTAANLKIKKYYDNPILSSSEINEELYKMVLSDNPFAAARIGGTELRNIVCSQKEHKNEKVKSSCYSLLKCLSGFCDEYEDIDRFSHLYEDALKSVDIMGVWFNQMEDVIIHRYCRNDILLGELQGLEPWYNPNSPWTKALKEKKVLVIHPFKDSIMSQYGKRAELFPETDILPVFELSCQKAIQTLYGERDSRVNNWFEGLDFMTDEALGKDFDIALIACGAYGLPLATRLKNSGKQAVHMGGALQLLFGVRGKRWDNAEVLKPFYSEAWEYPLASEHLSENNSNNVENGCYW